MGDNNNLSLYMYAQITKSIQVRSLIWIVNDTIKHFDWQLEKIIVIFGLVRHGLYNVAKKRLAELNQNTLVNKTYNFHGDDHNLFVRHINFFCKNTTESICSSAFCPQREKKITLNDIPTLSGKLSKTEFISKLIEWLVSPCPCRIGLTNLPKDEKYIKWIPKAAR